MEVGNEPVHYLKAVAGVDKNIRPCASGMKKTILIGIGFNRSAGGGSRADDSSAGFLRIID